MLKRKLTIYSYLAQKKLKRQLKRLTSRNEIQVFKPDEDYDSHIIDDLPLTINRDPSPGVRMQQEAAQ